MRSRSMNLRDYPAEKARGGAIILRHPWQRAVFIAGLAVPLILLFLVSVFPGVAG